MIMAPLPDYEAFCSNCMHTWFLFFRDDIKFKERHVWGDNVVGTLETPIKCPNCGLEEVTYVTIYSNIRPGVQY